MATNGLTHAGVAVASEIAEPRLRVLFVIDSTFPGAGGAEAQARKLARALKERGAVMEFVSPHVVTDMPINCVVDGTPCHRIAYPHVKGLGAIILLLRFAWYLFKRRKDFDVVHVHITRLLATVAVLMRPLTGLPVITKISGYFEFTGGVLDPDSNNLSNAFLRRILRKIDYVQTISVQTRELLLEAGFREEQIKYIPNGVDVSESIRLAKEPAQPGCYEAEEGVTVFGYCGRLRQIKGVEVLIDAFAAFVDTRSDRRVKLRIAGGGSLLTELSAQVDRLGLQECVEFVGVVEDTHEFYKSLDVYIQPSFAEGLPNSVIEAMVAGLPVLATNIGGNTDLISHGTEGWLFEAGDVAALSALMSRCLDEYSTLDTMGEAGCARIVETFDFSNVTEDLLELYRGKSS